MGRYIEMIRDGRPEWPQEARDCRFNLYRTWYQHNDTGFYANMELVNHIQRQALDCRDELFKNDWLDPSTTGNPSWVQNETGYLPTVGMVGDTFYGWTLISYPAAAIAGQTSYTREKYKPRRTYYTGISRKRRNTVGPT